MQKSGFFMKIIFCRIIFKVSAWLSNHAVCKIGLNCSSLLQVLWKRRLPERFVLRGVPPHPLGMAQEEDPHIMLQAMPHKNFPLQQC
jgi:hypothetical protein